MWGSGAAGCTPSSATHLRSPAFGDGAQAISRGGAMVTIITDKLRSQTLEDVESAPVPIPQSAGTQWSFPNGKVEANEAFPGWPIGGAERPPLDKISFPKVQFVTETLASTPPAPPSKRHCRSRSIPGDTEPSPWQPQPSSVWRPVAVRSHLSRRRSPLSGRVRHCSSPSGPPLRPLPRTASSSSPTSPSPRPASAASPGLEHGGPWPDGGLSGAFRSRSMSMEDSGLRRRRISAPSLHGPPPNAFNRDGQLKVPGAGSMPSIVGSETANAPGSPRLARCRSQPCVLHERKCLKRRREERPTLDLFKMQDPGMVPYTRHGLFHGRRYSSDQNLPHSRLLAPELVVGLNTIASSPLDSTLPGSLAGLPPGPPGLQESSHTDSTGSATPPDTTNLADKESECMCGDTGESAVFDLEINSDLDLEEIEKD